jgi:hypothetical protein
MKLTKSIMEALAVKESIDYHQFDVKTTGSTAKMLLGMAKCDAKDVKSILGVGVNDFEPDMYILTMNDGSYTVVNTERETVKPYLTQKQVRKIVFDED